MKPVEYYDAIARERTRYYQEATGPVRFLLHGPVERHVDRHIERVISTVESVADIGCGFGRYLVGLDRVRRVFLNDLSEEMIEAARAGVAQRYPGIVVSSQVGDALDVAIEQSGTYELVMSIGVINHLADEGLRQLLPKLARMAERKILLYYAHDRFVLAARVGISFRRRGIRYQCHARRAVEAALRARGFRPRVTSYVFGAALLSPMVLQEFEQDPRGS